MFRFTGRQCHLMVIMMRVFVYMFIDPIIDLRAHNLGARTFRDKRSYTVLLQRLLPTGT